MLTGYRYGCASGLGYGYGNSKGSGFGSGYLSGYGSGDHFGYGAGDGEGDGDHYGYGYGDSSGDGYGYGDGYGRCPAFERAELVWPGYMRVACEIHSVEIWREHWRAIALHHGKDCEECIAFAVLEWAEKASAELLRKWENEP